jgi:hypothetical protein
LCRHRQAVIVGRGISAIRRVTLLLGIVVTLTMLPETKGASLEEINAEHEQASPPRQAVAA